MKSAWMAGTPWCRSSPDREVRTLENPTAAGDFSAYVVGSVGTRADARVREVLEQPVSCGFAVIAAAEANLFSHR